MATRCHSLSLAVIPYDSFSLFVICCHSLSLVYHLLSLDVPFVCLFINDPYLVQKFQVTHILHYSDIMLKSDEFYIFLSGDFGKKCKHTELTLNFIHKQHFSQKKNIFPSLYSNSNTVSQQKFILVSLKSSKNST